MSITTASFAGAEAKFTANVSGSVSVGAGFMGADLARSIDLGSSRVLWLFGDTFWATGAGQARNACAFLHNSVALQTGSYDLSASTLTFYAGSGNTSFFAEDKDSGGVPRWFWPGAGIKIDDKVLIFLPGRQPYNSAFGSQAAGNKAVICDNITDTPDNWQITNVRCPSDPVGVRLALSLHDDGSYIYAWGTVGQGYWRLLRWVRDDAYKGSLLNPEYWTTAGWMPREYMEQEQGVEALAPAKVVADVTVNDGFVGIVSGTWRMCYMSLSEIAMTATGSAVTDTFPAASSFYTTPAASDSTQIAYQGYFHPEQTWAGMAAGDCLFTYATNASGAGSVYTDMTAYFTKCLKVSGL